ncbi:RDD family protein [Cerasicoccus fimbriatus]|uniref:RDD family protein n=1 Tax=Cerasicoccus fimbriatus TaxID=3014554 RepID=UPI0022B2EEAD|nr:RDD family protein [Cerasicoccus sp. TK19100]
MTSQRENSLVVETPEGVRFTMALASPAARLLALAVDLLVILTIAMVMAVIFSLMSLISGQLAAVAFILGYFILSIGYFWLLEWAWRGQTVGKRMFRLRVVDAHGLKLHTDQIVLRNLLRFVDSLPGLYFLGGCVSICSRRYQRLGDLAAGTVVVRQKPPALPDLSRLPENKYNSLHEHPHVEATLRQRISPELAMLAFQALTRRDQLEPTSRARVFAELASEFQTHVKLPETSLYGVSDEQLIRNCVESIYRQVQKRADGAESQLATA